MGISKYLLLGIFLIAVNCQDFSSENYLKLSSNEKLSLLWNEISKDQTSFGFYSGFEVAKIFLSDLSVTFNHKGDVLPINRKKLIHTTGNIAKAEWISTGDHPYTGIFTGSTNMLLRFSIAKKIDSSKKSADGALGNFAPGISLKFLRDGTDSANLVAMFSTGGQSSWNPFKNDFTNNFSLGNPSLAEKALATKFSSVTNNISAVGLKDMAQYGQDGKKIENIKFPFKLIFRPASDVNSKFSDEYTEYFTEQLLKINPDTVLYNIYAIDSPGCPEVKIGKIVTKTNLIKSKFGDEKLFFRHGLIDDDDAGKDWAQYRDYFSFFGGATPAKKPQAKSSCPFAKLL